MSRPDLERRGVWARLFPRAGMVSHLEREVPGAPWTFGGWHAEIAPLVDNGALNYPRILLTESAAQAAAIKILTVRLDASTFTESYQPHVAYDHDAFMATPQVSWRTWREHARD